MDSEKILQELDFKFTRSSGAGGQHVNKVSTKVVLQFHITNSTALSYEEKEVLNTRLHTRISKAGLLILTADSSRSQHKNKVLVIKRFLELLKDKLIPRKKRKKTKKPRSANLKRLERKKKRASTKTFRKKPKLNQ
jgi:ribosome-associated protein